jgi:hypothetical protein
MKEAVPGGPGSTAAIVLSTWETFFITIPLSSPPAARLLVVLLCDRLYLVLPWDMVDNSISPLRTNFELIFSSFDCTVGYFIL